MKKYFLVCLSFLAILASQEVLAQTFEALNICGSERGMVEVESFYAFSTTDSSHSIPADGNFKIQTSALDLGNVPKTHWIKIELENYCGTEDMLLKIDNPALDFYEAIVIDSDRLKEVARFSYDETGELSPKELAERLLIPIKESYGQNLSVYLRILSGEHLFVPISVGSERDLSEERSTFNTYLGIYMGLMLAMILYNLFIYFSVKDRDYLYYIGVMATVCIAQLTFQGFTKEYWWNESPFFSDKGVYLFGALSNIFTLVFVYHFLKIPAHFKRVKYLFWLFLLLAITGFFAAIFGFYHVSYTIIDYNGICGALVVLSCALYLSIKGDRSARFFLIGWSFFLGSVVIFILKDFGVLPYTAFTRFSVMLGSMLEAILLSFALADRINVLKVENELKEQEKLRALEEKRMLIVKQNETLERKVEERTHDLLVSNQELDEALHTLKNAQSQLIESEKMASLGQLTASIAHELNNPINFVSSNVEPLKLDLQEIFDLFDQPDFNDEKKQAELNMLKGEANMLLDGIQDGAKRTADIVKGLRIFSRMDEKAFQTADLNECLRSTFIILKTGMKHICNIDVNYGELPETRCNPGKITQVFTNIITNAAQALEASGKPKAECTITASTHFTGGEIIIRIEDNGPGIPPAAQEKVFDPFYTTKKVGKGTGLGLSIAKGIVEDHSGTIEFHTQKDVGTKFEVRIPFIQ